MRAPSLRLHLSAPSSTSSSPTAAPANASAGALFALGAYGIWGIVPVYWKKLAFATAPEIVAHRVIWSVVFLAAVLSFVGRSAWGAVRAAIVSKRTLGMLAVTTALIAANWGLFIWAVQTGHILQASLGYYVNPLVSVVAGVLVLGERLTRGQTIAVGLATAAVVAMTIATGTLPWISLVLAATFAAYGLLRKLAPVDAMAGLFVETLLVAPFALAFVVMRERTGLGALHQGALHATLVALAGPITAVPLLFFVAAAKRLPLSTLGFFQYVSPTLQFLVAVLLYGEKLALPQLLTFGAIWIALVIFTLGSRKGA